MEFLYQTTCNTTVKFEKQKFKDFQSKASIKELEELKAFLPAKEEVDANEDLLFFSCNAAVAGLCNLNNDGILIDTAVAMSPHWQSRPVNVEHNKNNVVGFIQRSGFATFPDNKVLTTEEAVASENPVNITIGGLIWKFVDPFLASYIEDASKEGSYCYKELATSWEIGFNEYYLALDSKNLSRAELIKDPEKIEELKGNLVRFGGTGFTSDNREIYMVISGDARPLGLAITCNPAAPVSGIIVPESDAAAATVEESVVEIVKESIEHTVPLTTLDEKNKKSLTKISNSHKKNVKFIKSMRITNLDELFDAMSEASASGAQLSPKEIREFLNNQVKAANDEWVAKLQEKEAKAAELTQLLEAAKAANADFERVKSQLEEMKAKAAEQAEKSIFDDRMALLDEKYDLDAKTRKVIAKQIKGLSDEDYTIWSEEDGSVILANKEKSNKPAPEVDPIKALEHSTASKEYVPNATVNIETKEKEEEIMKPWTVKVKGNQFEI